MNLCVAESWSMHLSGLLCTCNPLFATHTSQSPNLSSWSVCREWTDSYSSIYDWSVSSTFFADHKETTQKFPFWVTNFWNGALFQYCLHFQIYFFCYSWFNFGTFGAFFCTSSVRRGIWVASTKTKISWSFLSSFQAGRNLSDCNWTRTHNHLIHKRTLNHLANLAFYLNDWAMLWKMYWMKWLQLDSNPEPLNSLTNTQPFGQISLSVRLWPKWLWVWVQL